MHIKDRLYNVFFFPFIFSLSGCRVFSWTTEQAIVRHVNFQQIKCLLLGSPGFVKDDFFEFLNLEAVRREERVSFCVSLAP